MTAEALQLAALGAALGVPVYAWLARGRIYGAYCAVLLALCLPGAVWTYARLVGDGAGIGAGFGHALFGYGLLAAATHTSARARPRVRGRGFQLAVSLPAQTFLATGFLCGAWFLALALPRAVLALTGWDAGLSALRWLDWVPLGVGAAALVTSLRQRLETVRIPLGDAGPERVERVPHARYRGRAPDLSGPRPLRIAQIADPHLGPWQTVEKLRRRAASLVAEKPDLVALTGDFLTMESHDAAEALARRARAAARAARPLLRRLRQSRPGGARRPSPTRCAPTTSSC